MELEDCRHIIEVTALDQWMTTTTDKAEDSVQLKACPKCKKTIRNNLRYGDIINAALADIEKVKVSLSLYICIVYLSVCKSDHFYG